MENNLNPISSPSASVDANILHKQTPGGRNVSWYSVTPILQIVLIVVGFYLGIGAAWGGDNLLATLINKLFFGLTILVAIFPITKLLKSKFSLENLIFAIANLIVPAIVLYIYFAY